MAIEIPSIEQLTLEEQDALGAASAENFERRLAGLELTRALEEEYGGQIRERAEEFGFPISQHIFNDDLFALHPQQFDPSNLPQGYPNFLEVKNIYPEIRISPSGALDYTNSVAKSTSTRPYLAQFGNDRIDKAGSYAVISGAVDETTTGNQRQAAANAEMGHKISATKSLYVEMFYEFKPQLYLEVEGMAPANGFDARLTLLSYPIVYFLDQNSGKVLGFDHPGNGYSYSLTSMATVLATNSQSFAGHLQMPSKTSQSFSFFVSAGHSYITAMVSILHVNISQQPGANYRINAQAKIDLI
jgi:hypothetical protein